MGDRKEDGDSKQEEDTRGTKPQMKECRVHDTVMCPGTGLLCAGNQCCLDGSACPSAENTFRGCEKRKTEDCTGSSNSAAPLTPNFEENEGENAAESIIHALTGGILRRFSEHRSVTDSSVAGRVAAGSGKRPQLRLGLLWRQALQRDPLPW